MKLLITAALAIMAALCPIQSSAMAVDTPPATYQIITDTAPILNVSVATHQFTSLGTLSGGHYLLVQSTDATSGFCCSFEATASTTGIAGTPGCIRAKKEPGAAFYELEVRRWARDLTFRCQTFATVAAKTLAVLQGR